MSKLKLDKANLYANGEVLNFADGEQWLIRDEIEYEYNEGDTVHKIVQGDELGALAWKYYRFQTEKPEWYWYAIADTNLIENPLDLTALIGTYIIIPSLTRIELIN